MRLKPALLAAGLLLAVPFLGAQSADVLSGDQRPSVKAGVALFTAHGLSDDQAGLVSSFPLRLREGLGSVTERRLGPEELTAYRSWALNKARFDAGGKLQDSRLSLDRQAFSAQGPSSAQQADSKKKIESAGALLDYYDSLDPSLLKADDTRPIEWQNGSDGGRLLAEVEGDPGIACAKRDLDLLLYGDITGFEDYLAVDVCLYSRFLGRPLFAWKTAFAQDDSGSALSEVEGALRDSFAGVPTGAIRLSVEPESADIYLDSSFAGRGDSLLSGIGVGMKRLRIEAEGRAPVSLEISVEASKVTDVSVRLSKTVEGSVSVVTSPEGEPVYLDALRVGRGPVELEATGGTHVVGSRDALGAKAAAVSPLAPGLTVKLAPVTADPSKGFLKRRDQFYESFGWFLLSLPAYLVTQAVVQSYQNEALADSNSIDYLNSDYQKWVYANDASIGVSAGLLGYSIYRFIVYLDSTGRR